MKKFFRKGLIRILTIGTLVAVLTMGFLSFFVFPKTFSFGEATDSNTPITLDSHNSPTDKNEYQDEVVYKDIQYATFTYQKVKAANNALCALNTGGVISKDEARGLSTLSIYFIGSLQVNTGFESPNEDEKVIEQSGSIHVCGNYFSITALEETTIQSLTINFDCNKPTSEHKYGEWHQKTAPTPLVNGEDARNCTWCNHEETRSTTVSYGEKAEYAVDNSLTMSLSSANVAGNDHITTVNETIYVGKTSGSTVVASTKSFNKYYVSKGMATDGERIWTILNAKTGSTKNSGFDVGIVAEIDTNGNVLRHTPFAFHWGNINRLSYHDGSLYVSRPGNPSSSSYGTGTNFTSYVIQFNADTLAYVGHTSSASFSFPSFGISDSGYFDMIATNKDNNQCAIIYKATDTNSFTLYTYKKNNLGVYENVADGVALPNAYRGEESTDKCWGLSVVNDYIYTMWSVAAGGVIRVSDLDGTTILDKTIDNPQEGTGTQKNYQGIIEIDNVLYYSIASWKSGAEGLMFFRVDISFPGATPYLVSFDANGANVNIPRQVVISGNKVVEPAAPTHSFTDSRGKTYNYVFENWYLGEDVWDFENDVVTSDMTLKANYTYPDAFFDVDENASDRANNTKVRIMSFNVLSADWNNKPPVDNTRANQAFDTIERYQPDVVGLQEFDNAWYTKASTLLDGYAIVNASSKTIGGIVNYSTIAYNTSKVSLLQYTQTRLTTCDNKKCRNLTIAAFEFISGSYVGERFIVTSTHWNLEETDRVSQAIETASLINNFQSNYPNAPVFATGDYNSFDNTPPMNTFLEESGYYDSKVDALDADVVCNTLHLGTPMRVGDKDYTNPNHCFRGPASFGFKNVQTDSCIDHICVSNDVTTLFYNTVHDEVVLNSSDHCAIYIDASF